MFLVSGLDLKYPNQERNLLEGINISLQAGELLFLRGPNGSGKTSLLNAISGIIPQRVKAGLAGSISLNGIDLQPVPLNERFRHLAYQMSDPDNQIFFPRLAKELSFALENAGLPGADIHRRIDLWAEHFGLGGFWQTEPGKLSRGQKKILILAVCAAMETPLVLLDEPSSGLDYDALARVKAWLEQVLGQGRIVIMAEHDPELSSLATKTLVLGQ
ncbi:MAG: energy-coupling factor ABC transporter ATP-binding protein [Candidatus Syntrophosphaera sp.]|nr:energy-coupling factor ABC transporter ATP-binding protein [Candidatus Syntrophosphaera sp.]